ncbi:hypothetical protein BJ165DRAFT_1425238 [Panaeolus papilionaceus]|nr:hypothetical protein BJ165DRAFT_1425238 [Panaeolus papilionaceus]
MNGRSYYRWIITLLERTKPNMTDVQYTPGHSKENTMAARMNDEADMLASTAQKNFMNQAEIPAPTFHMNDFTLHHSNDGWIESNIPSYIDARLNEKRMNEVHARNDHRMAKSTRDSHCPPPEYPYLKATSAHSAAVQLYARSGQLPTANILKKRNIMEDDICRMECGNYTETPRHIFVICSKYETWRTDATNEVVKQTKLKAETMEIPEILAQNLIHAAESLFRDNELIWPLHVSLYYLGQIPNIDSLLTGDESEPLTHMKKLRIKAHISSDWHTSAIRLTGRIFGDFQKRMAVANGCPRRGLTFK